MENLKKLQEEKEYWNETAMTLLNENRRFLNERNDAIKVLKGLLNDFKYFIGDSDKEPQRAGFIVEAENFLGKHKVEQ